MFKLFYSFIFLLIFVFFESKAQKGLYIGFRTGPSYNIVTTQNPISPLMGFGGWRGGAQHLTIEYGFNNYFSLIGSISLNSYGLSTSLDSPNYTSIGSPFNPTGNVVNQTGGTSTILFKYMGFDIGLKYRIPIVKNRTYFTHSLSVGIMPTWSNTVEVSDGGSGGSINGYSTNFQDVTPNNIYDPTLTGTIGVEYRLFKRCFLTLDLTYLKGFKEIAYQTNNSQVAGANYYNRSSCDGSIYGLNIGLKIPLFNKHPLDTSVYHDTSSYDHTKLSYKKGTQLVGFNTRILDQAGTSVPFNLGFQAQYYYFKRDRLAFGAIAIVKCGYYNHNNLNEYIAGLAVRYYAKKSSNWNVFGELNILEGYNYKFQNPFQGAIALAPGLVRKLGGNWSIESSVKFMYTLSKEHLTIAGQNTLVNVGINYHF